MKVSLWLLAAAAATMAYGDDFEDRAKLIGKWQQEGASGTIWVLENKDNTKLHVTEMLNGQKVADYSCSVMGSQCKVKDSGKDATVSFWYNGSKLVQMETRGSEVTKRRFSPAGDAAMELETIPIVPDGKAEVSKFKKVDQSQ